MKHEINIKPFPVPDFVIVDRHSVMPTYIPLTELSDETLEELCARFKKDVLAKARTDFKTYL